VHDGADPDAVALARAAQLQDAWRLHETFRAARLGWDRTMRPARLLHAALLAALTSGCWIRTSGGYARALNQGVDAQGAAVNVEIGSRPLTSSLHEPDGPYVVTAVRSKITKDLSDAGFAFALAWMPRWRPVSFYVDGGAHIVQFGTYYGDFSYGMGGPFIEGGLVLSPERSFGITLGPSLQYDLRFTTPNQVWFGVHLGLLLATALAD
jgi:hypothetical protein